MEHLLNDLITEIITSKTPSENKLEVFKREHAKKEQEHNALKILYNNKHETPRIQRKDALNKFISENNKLKKEYVNSTPTERISKLHDWLRHLSNVPEILSEKQIDIYTFYS